MAVLLSFGETIAAEASFALHGARDLAYAEWQAMPIALTTCSC